MVAGGVSTGELFTLLHEHVLHVLLRDARAALHAGAVVDRVGDGRPHVPMTSMRLLAEGGSSVSIAACLSVSAIWFDATFVRFSRRRTRSRPGVRPSSRTRSDTAAALDLEVARQVLEEGDRARGALARDRHRGGVIATVTSRPPGPTSRRRSAGLQAIARHACGNGTGRTVVVPPWNDSWLRPRSGTVQVARGTGRTSVALLEVLWSDEVHVRRGLREPFPPCSPRRSCSRTRSPRPMPMSATSCNEAVPGLR